MKTILRSEYMADKVDHQTYYAQFCNQSVLSLVASLIGIDRIKSSSDPHFNDIPLIEWDRLADSIRAITGRKIAEANGSGGISLSDCVCTAKAAARIIKESGD